MPILLSILQLLISLFSLAVLGIFAYYMVRSRLPFVPSNRETVRRLVAAARISPGDKAADLGSGDGRIVLALARAGAEAHGFEINPVLVWWSRRKIRRAGLHGRAFIHRRSFWDPDVSEFDVVILYCITDYMKRMEAKLRRELRPGARVVSNAFTFPTWLPAREEEKVLVYEQNEPHVTYIREEESV